MEKDFDNWNEKKKLIHKVSESKLYNEREVWWCSLGINVGFEQNGVGVDYQRPVLILKGISKDVCMVLPLTTSLKKHKMRISIGIVASKPATALLSQSRVIDTKRLINKVGFLDKEIFEKIRKAVKDLL